MVYDKTVYMVFFLSDMKCAKLGVFTIMQCTSSSLFPFIRVSINYIFRTQVLLRYIICMYVNVVIKFMYNVWRFMQYQCSCYKHLIYDLLLSVACNQLDI
jgi:hypothetical protein